MNAEFVTVGEMPQFYIQLVDKPHFGSHSLLFGQLRAVMKKKLSISEQLLRVGFFSTFCSVRTKKLHKSVLKFRLSEKATKMCAICFTVLTFTK